MFVEVVKLEGLIRMFPERGMTWNSLCEAVNQILEESADERAHHEHSAAEDDSEGEATPESGTGSAAVVGSVSGGDSSGVHPP